ncbi:MAG: SdrD B-like domain-containing protein, partial [bacterium]|nr:SdrD B-like domain-containing protein [bacterium]
NSFPGEESPGTDKIVNPGTYNVTEGGPDGYESNFSTDCSGTIALGQTKTCTVTNDDKPATLTVIKHVINDSGGNAVASDFTMNVTGANVSSSSFAGSESGVSVTLDAGFYSVDEDGLSGYIKSLGANCSGTITIGQTKTCTVTNDDVAPTITLIKDVDNEYGGNAAPSDFTLKIDGQGVTQTTAIPVTANSSHTINEDLISGYQFVSIAGSAKCPSVLGGTVTLNEGENITCTITNEDIPAHIALTKVVNNNNGGNAGADDFGLTIGGTSVTSGQTSDVNSNTPIALNEAGLTGYNFVSITGDAKCPQVLGGTVTLNENESVSCTITNDDIAPTLTLVKILPNDNGGTATQDDFNVYINDQSAIWGQNIVNAGDLTVSEGTLTGYEPSVWGGDCDENGGITLLPGDNKTCTITNDDQEATLTLVKVLPNDDGGQSTQDNFNVYINDNQSSWGSHNLNAGSYTVSEDAFLPGYVPSAWGGDCDTNGTIVLTPGDEKTCEITNDDQPGSISGQKFEDENGDGLKDEGENGLENWTINLTGTVNTSTVTDADGNYSFEDLPAGDYSVSETQKPGWTLTTTTSIPVNLANGQPVTGVDFGNFKNIEVTVCKYIDVNGDGDISEDPLYTEEGGWEVSLSEDTQNTIEGCYTFADIGPGDYDVTEEIAKEGWTQTYPEEESYNFDAISGQDESFDFGNQQLGRIIVSKVTDPENSEETFEFTTDYNENFFLGNGGSNESGFLSPGTYSVSENTPDGWGMQATCDDQSVPDEIELQQGETVTCTFTNTQRGSIGDFVWNDQNGDTVQDIGEPGISGVVLNLYLDNGDGIFEPGGDDGAPIATDTTDGIGGGYLFANLAFGNYWVDADGGVPAGYTLTTANDPLLVNLSPGENEDGADFGYQFIAPTLTISKSNNKTGLSLLTGDNVTFTITLEAQGNGLQSVVATDLFSYDFIYRVGSWTATSSIRGDLKGLGIVSEPHYASPGVWLIGDMAAGEIITLSYIADIAGSQQPGLYKDLAWAKGTSRNSSQILASAVNPGKLDDHFVGTDIRIVKEQQPGTSADLESIEKREVLGASTVLPATGAQTFWLILAVALLVFGVSSILAGLKLKQRYEN